jgi:hypothetical protein
MAREVPRRRASSFTHEKRLMFIASIRRFVLPRGLCRVQSFAE